MKRKLNILLSHIKSGDIVPDVCAYLMRRANGIFFRNPASFEKYYKQQSKLNFIDNRCAFYLANGYWPNLNAPQSLNEKCLYLKLFSRDPLLPIIADKYTVRDYVAKKVGSDVLVPLHQVVEKPQDIDFDKLPDKFVIKASWASGRNIIVRDKNKLNVVSANDHCEKWLAENYRIRELIWFCQEMDRRIIIEQFISDSQRSLPIDYKFYVFNGKVEFCNTVSDRDTEKKLNFFDRDWNLRQVQRFGRPNDQDLRRPGNYVEMIHIAEALASDLDFMRVDLYSKDGTIMFGELTPYPGNALGRFTPTSFDYELGSLWKMDLTHITQ